MNFFEKYMRNQAKAEDIYAHEAEWVNSKSYLPIHEFLGMNKKQYETFKEFLNFTNNKK